MTWLFSASYLFEQSNTTFDANLMLQNPSESGAVFIFCALHCEAKPVIDFLELKKLQPPGAFEIYRRPNLYLTITGIGKANMAAGVGYTLALDQAETPITLLNIGIAGHKSAELGGLFLAEKITDADTTKSHYPQRVPYTLCASQVLITVSQPQTDYAAEHTLYDMEASAFYEIASRFTSSELIMTLKIVSDNAQSSIQNIHPKKVSDWVASHLETIQQVINESVKRCQSLNVGVVNPLEELLTLHHFTVSETVQLKALVSRWNILSNAAPLPLTPAEFKSTRAFLETFNARIDQLSVVL